MKSSIKINPCIDFLGYDCFFNLPLMGVMGEKRGIETYFTTGEVIKVSFGLK